MSFGQTCRAFLALILFLCILLVTGCALSGPEPVATATQTKTATKTATSTPLPTATKTYTAEPSPTATRLSVPTSSVPHDPGLIMSSECRQVIDGLIGLKSELGLPEHFMAENPSRQSSDFDPNQYFKVMTHLSIAPGYELDFIYFNDELGGLPLVYARRTSSTPFRSYEDILASFGEEIAGERSYGQLRHKYDYLERIQIDGTHESYFQFVTLAFLGDQFYLWWHGLYNDAKILCDSSDLQYVYDDLEGFELEFPKGVEEGIAQIDFVPVVVVDDKSVTVRYVTFTKWGGFFENVYVMDRENPTLLLDVRFNPLIEYECGISF